MYRCHCVCLCCDEIVLVGLCYHGDELCHHGNIFGPLRMRTRMFLMVGHNSVGSTDVTSVLWCGG